MTATVDTDVNKEASDTIDVLELSDEDFSKLTFSKNDTEGSSDETSTNQSESSTAQALESEETSETDPRTESVESGIPGDNDSSDTSFDTGSSEDGKEDDKASSEKKTEIGKETPSDAQVVDYEAEYKKLMTPFKANGVDMQIQSIDDAIQLMQMGAGFHKKMSALKPAMRQMKLLEKNGLLDDEKLNYLIDLHHKNPEAIQKLLKDSNLDPLDIDVKAEVKYTPTSRRVSDTEIALDDVLNNIRETPTYHRTLNVVSKEWDEISQNAIANEPQIIQTINGHMQDGTFDAVMRRVEYERSLGRLSGVSDIHAYMQTGNAMADEGKLHRLGSPAQQTQPSIQPVMAKPSKQEIERIQNKRAASPTKAIKTTATPVLNPLDMSDEDFAKLDINKFIRKSS